jgi:hypothetical protein
MGYKSTKQNKYDPSTTSNGLLGSPSAINGEETTLVSECESHCSVASSATKTEAVSADVEVWELLSSSTGEQHDEDVDGERESDISSFEILSTTINNEEIECDDVDKDVLDILVLGDSDSFRLLSTPEQKEATTRKRSFLCQDGAGDDINDALRQMHEKRARRVASVFASPPDQHYALQKLRRKSPVCLFVNFLGTRCPQEAAAKSSSSTTTTITTETRVSSLKVSEYPESKPSDLPTKSTYLITRTAVSKKLDAPSSPHLVTPEGLKMLEALGLSICPCKIYKKHSTMSFQASKDPSLSSCCFPALPLAPAFKY